VVGLQTGSRPLEKSSPDPANGRLTWDNLFASLNRDRAPSEPVSCYTLLDLALQVTGPDSRRLIPGTLWGVIFNTYPHSSVAMDFLGTSRRAVEAAVRHKKALGEDVKPWVRGEVGWFWLLCREAMGGVPEPYDLAIPFQPDEDSLGSPGDIARRDAFLKSWDFEARWPPPGVYIISPWVDARIASFKVIELILASASADELDEDLIICTNSDLLRFNGLETPREGYAKQLSTKGVLKRLVQRSTYKIAVVFADPSEGKRFKAYMAKTREAMGGRERRPRKR
jgi:hypothetical protein